jgi:hypothetical protein
MLEGKEGEGEYMLGDNRNLSSCRVLQGVHDFIRMNERVIEKEWEYKLYLYLHSSERQGN